MRVVLHNVRRGQICPTPSREIIFRNKSTDAQIFYYTNGGKKIHVISAKYQAPTPAKSALKGRSC
jgi:hypothetical protein